mmetsp:Transcript_6016/g.14844  ORF Transcript_6016/g.14844 Transcript_6016/m.14844 type:complete len:202 (+) Transcript_6016:2248-2853(+)
MTDSEFTISTCLFSVPSDTSAETPSPWARRFNTCPPAVLEDRAARAAVLPEAGRPAAPVAGETPSSSPWKIWKSCFALLPRSCSRSSCEMQCSTCCHEGPKLLPSERPIARSAFMHSMFFCFISLMVVRYVNFARDETKASRSVSMSKRAAILMQCLKPSMQSSMLRDCSCISSSTASVASMGQEATSKSGRTCSTFWAAT